MTLKEVCISLAPHRNIDLSDKTYSDRLEEEISVISPNGFDSYFFICADIVNYCKKRGLPVNLRGCYHPDTFVYTTNRGLVKISNIKIGDKVINRYGKKDTVDNKLSYDFNGTLYEIQHWHGSKTYFPKKCTGDHKQLICRDDKILWMRSDRIKIGDFVCTPKFSYNPENINIIDLNDYNFENYNYDDEYIYEKLVSNKPYKYSLKDIVKNTKLSKNTVSGYLKGDCKTKKENWDKIYKYCKMTPDELKKHIKKNKYHIYKIKRFLKPDNIFYRVLGLMAGDGYCGEERKISGLAYNTLTRKYNYNKNIFEKFIKNICSSDDIIYFHSSKNRNLESLNVNSRILFNFFKKEFATKDKNGFKYIKEKWLNVEKKYLQKIFFGLINSDGCVRKGFSSFDNTSKKLTGNFIEICHKIGIKTTSKQIRESHTRKNSHYKCKESYKVGFNFTNKRLVKDNYWLSKVTKINKIAYQGKVYDLTIRNNPSFMLDSMITHNSASGSLVVYLLGISEIEPIKHGLSFARFLNKARIDGGIDSFPDIDIDVSKNYRKDVIQYIINKYGEDRVCLIRNYNVSTLNSSIRNGVMKIWEGDITHNHVNNILKNTNLQDNNTVEEVLDDPDNVDFINEYNKGGEFKEICDIANKMIGCVYSYGCHAGGVVIFNKPIHEVAPLTVTKQGFPSIQADKKDLSMIGGVKLDLLGLKALDDIYDACGGAQVNWLDFYHKFDLDDEIIYQNTRELKTDGVFTLETQASKACISEIKPTSFQDIIAVQALIRPGAKEYISDYAKVKNEGYNILESHPYFKHILDIIEPTYGVILYQEQIMKISQKLSGFSDSEADILRKAIGKKKMDLLNKMKDKFIKNSNHPKDAEKIWNVIEKAGNYSFNKSHAVAYAYISFASLYVKTYNPEYWYGALFKNSDNKDKLTQYIQTCQIDIKNPSIKHSKMDIVSVDKKLYFGFSLIKGAKDKYIEATIQYQENHENFNMYDFISYTNIDKGTFEAFIIAGVFDDVGYKRSQLLNSSEMILDLVKNNEKAIIMEEDEDYKIAKNLKTTTLLLEDDSLTRKSDINSLAKDLGDFIMLSEIKYYWKHIKKHVTNVRKNKYKKSKEYILDQINLTHENAKRESVYYMLELERDVLNFVVTVHPNKIIGFDGKNLDLMEEGESNTEIAYIESIKEAKTKNGNTYYKASAEFEKFQRYISVFTFKGQKKPEQGFNEITYTTRTWNNKMYINVDKIRKL